MPDNKKTVRFDFFKPYYLITDDNGNTTEQLYDLSSLFQFVDERPFSETKKKVLGDTHMFHICKYHEERNIWELQVLHLREKMLPGIADDAGAFKLIELEDNEYPAESTTLIFNVENNILYMQRNIYGTSISALEEYLRLLSPEGTKMLLKPIHVDRRISQVTENKFYRKIILTADSTDLPDEGIFPSLRSLIKSFSNYQGKCVKFEIGFGHKSGNLDSSQSCQLIREAYEYSGTSKLNVSLSDDEDTHVETIDLMDDRANYKVDITYSRENPITHDRLFNRLLMALD